MKKVLLLLPQGFEAYEASVFTDVLGWSHTGRNTPVTVVTAGSREKINCTWNLTVIPELLLPDVNVAEYAALAIPGGFEKAGFYQDMYSDAMLSLIRAFFSENKIIAAVCVAALALGKSGILKGRNATTYHLLNGLKRRQLSEFGVNVIDGPIVIDNTIITSTSPATAIDVAFLLLEMLTSKINAEKVRHAMGFSSCISKDKP